MTEKLWQGWKYWKNKTQIEKDAIDSMLKAKDYILKNIPKKEIVSIYVCGSFVRREMTKNSDLDMLAILSSEKYIGFFERTMKKDFVFMKVPVDISFFTLKELKRGKNIRNNQEKISPSLLIPSEVKKMRLICGKKISLNKLPRYSNEKLLEKELILVRSSLPKVKENF